MSWICSTYERRGGSQLKEYIRCFMVDGASCDCYVKADRIERFLIDTTKSEPVVRFCLIDDPKKLQYLSRDVDYFEVLILNANQPINRFNKDN